MFSLQTIFGKGDKFYGLLEASADAARAEHARPDHDAESESPVRVARRIPRRAPARKRSDRRRSARRSSNTFVTALEREDIEALSARALQNSENHREIRRTLRAVRRPAHRRSISPRARAMLETRDGRDRGDGHPAAQRHAARRDEGAQRPHAGDRGRGRSPDPRSVPRPLRAIRRPSQLLLRKDLFELLEKAIDRCRDAGNVISHIVLKNS